MEGIQVISSSTIQIQTENNLDFDDDKIHLIQWDIRFLTRSSMLKRGLLFNKPKHTKEWSIQIQGLKDSLGSTLAFFPPLAGRIVIIQYQDNSTASSYISCNNAGALFVHAVAVNTRVSDILQPKYVPPFVKSFFALNEAYNHQGTSNPLLALQVTELVDGLFVACTMNHLVGDGKSIWHFINSWAEISRGCNQLSKPPVFERWFPDTIEPPIRFPFTKEETQSPENSDPKPPPPPPQQPLFYRIFHFTKEKIAQIKSKANKEVGTDKISSLQALLAHIYCSMIRANFVDPEEAIYYILPMDVRSKMVPPLPGDYFGNGVMEAFGTIRAKEVLEGGGIGKFAWEMNKLIASHTSEKVRSHYESCLRTPVMIPKKLGGAGVGKMSMVSSSPRFDVYGNDFGWGRPVAVRADAIPVAGMIHLFSGVEEGSIDIGMFLPLEIFEALGNDPDLL